MSPVFDIITALPTELSFRILTLYVDIVSVCNASVCCKTWRQLINTEAIWRALCSRFNFGENFESLSTEAPLELGTTPSQLAPFFDHSCFQSSNALPQVCRFKRIFAYGYHVTRNWRTGRYSVGPLLRGHTQQVTALGCNNRLVVTGSEDGTINVYDLISAQLLYTLSNQAGQVTQLLFMSTSNNPAEADADPMLLAASLDGHIRTFDATFGMLQSAIHVGRPVTKMVPLDDIVVIATSIGSIEFWDLTTQSCIERLNLHHDEIECLASCGKDLVASGGWDRKFAVARFLRNGNSRTRQPVVQLMFVNELHNEAVTACCFVNEKRLISGSADGSVRFWDVNTARCVASGYGHQPSSEVYCLACCVATNVAASGASDSAVCIWSLDRFTLLRCLVGDHVGIIRCILIDAHKLISASDRKRVVVWDYMSEDGKQLQVLHRQPILISHAWASLCRLVLASPEKPGAAVVLSFW